MLLNFMRWTLALALLLPLSWRVLRRNSPLWLHWRRYAFIGLLGIGCYNALQYLALKTSGPINVTLVAASLPLWMLGLGTLLFNARISGAQMLGALLSMAGVLTVLSHGHWEQLLALRLVPGDLYMLLATACWSLYSWLLVRTQEPVLIRGDWAAFLTAQLAFGWLWSGAFSIGEWAMGNLYVEWTPTLLAAVAYIAIGPAVLAYRAWGAGVQRVGPTMAGFFANLTPLFAAVLSAAFLGEPPHLYHGIAFALIVGGIVVSSRK